METFKPIINYENYYEIGNNGTVRGLDRHVTNRGNKMFVRGVVIRPSTAGPTKNYFSVSLRKDGIRKAFSVHRLVAMHFISDFNSDLQVNHIDRNTFNNHISNLEMVTPKENMNHAKVTGFTFGKVKIRNSNGDYFDSLSEACESLRLKRNKNNKFPSGGLSRAIKTNTRYYGFNWYRVEGVSTNLDECREVELSLAQLEG